MIHNGSCNCGRIAFEVEGDVPQVMECNCSYCDAFPTLTVRSLRSCSMTGVASDTVAPQSVPALPSSRAALEPRRQ
jgi:hypothetical protein